MARANFGPFSIDTPTGWTFSTLVLAGPVEEQATPGMLTTKAVRPFQQNLIVQMEQVAKDETAEKYYQRQVEGLKKAQVSRKETAKPEVVQLSGGRSGLVTEASVLGPGGEQVRQLQLITIKDGVAYLVIATHLDGAPYDKVKATFRSMLTSFA